MEEDEELLREACAVGNVIAAEFYLKKGVSVNCQHKISKFTPLHWAYSRDQEGIINLLKKYRADESLLDAKGRLANECKPIEFKPNYIKNPDLNKLWGIPDSRVVEVPQPNLPKKDLVEPKVVVQEHKEDSTSSAGTRNSARTMQILVFVSSKVQSNLKGAVFINHKTTLGELKVLISHDLEGIPQAFDIARVYGDFVVPMTSKQMNQNAYTHFYHATEAGIVQNTADLIIFPKTQTPLH